MKKSSKVIKCNHLYYISSNPQEEEKIIKGLNLSFIDKVKATKNTKGDNTFFINIYLNNKLNESEFFKLCDKLNKVISKKYKMFYTDDLSRFVYTHKDIEEEINKSFSLFINDD